MLERTVSFLDTLTAAQDLEGAFDAFRQWAEGIGFPEVLIGACEVAGASERPAVWRTTIPEELIGPTIDPAHLGVNPVHVRSRHAQRPFSSHIQSYRDVPKTRIEQDVYDAALAMSATLRIALPAMWGAGGLRWHLSVGGDYPLKEAERVLAHRGEALWLAGAAVVARLEVVGAGWQVASPTVLTRRERECLLRLAKGDRVDRIAEKLGVSSSAVELHLRNARRKLGARTSPEAVAKAVLRRWIEP